MTSGSPSWPRRSRMEDLDGDRPHRLRPHRGSRRGETRDRHGSRSLVRGPGGRLELPWWHAPPVACSEEIAAPILSRAAGVAKLPILTQSELRTYRRCAREHALAPPGLRSVEPDAAPALRHRHSPGARLLVDGLHDRRCLSGPSADSMTNLKPPVPTPSSPGTSPTGKNPQAASGEKGPLRPHQPATGADSRTFRLAGRSTRSPSSAAGTSWSSTRPPVRISPRLCLLAAAAD